MATSSGLYSDRIKDIMGGKSSTDDRAKDYKETVEIKQTKNKMDKLDETTRIFQAHLLKSTLNSEEHLKHIAKHTKIMAKETLSSNIIKLLKYGYVFYRAFKFFKPEAIPNAIKKFEDFIQRNSQGARGMKSQCCCDVSGMRGRMGRTRRRQERAAGRGSTTYSDGYSARDDARRRTEIRNERSRQARMDKAERIRRTASDLRQRKISQLQAKHTQDAITKSMRKWNGTARRSITGIFDASGAGLKGASSAISRAAAGSSSTLIRTGLAAVAGITAYMTGLLSSAASVLGKGLGATGRGAMALGRGGMALGARLSPAVIKGALGKAGPIGAAGLGVWNLATIDPKSELKTVKNTSFGNRLVAAQGSTLDTILMGIPGRSLARSGEALGPGAATNLSQLLEDLDHGFGSGADWIAGKLGFETNLGRRGLLGAAGNEIGASWSRVYDRIFNPVTSKLDEQTEALSERLDTNFKNMHLDHREARKLAIENDKLNKGYRGIPNDQGHGIPYSPVAPRPRPPASHQANDGPDSPMSSAANKTSPADTYNRLMDRSTHLTGETARSSGWSQYDRLGYSEPTPVGFTGEGGTPNQILSTKPGNNVGGVSGMYSGVPTSASDAMLRSIMVAETGSAGGVLDEKRFIRTRVTPEKNQGRHSSAYGPTQMTRDYLRSFKRRNYDSLPKEEQAYLDRLIAQNDTMLTTSRSGNYTDSTYGFGGKGTTGGTLRDRQLYGQIAQRSMIDLAKQHSTYASFIRAYRGANDSGYFRKIEAAAKQYGITPEEMFQRMKAMDVSDVAALDSGSPIISAGLMNPDSIGLTSSVSDASGGSASQIAIDMTNQRATRNKPITDSLNAKIQYAAQQAGLDRVEVYSGGQDFLGKGSRRTGSTNHDGGHAGDLNLWYQGRKLDHTNPDDRPIIQSFVENAVKAGATGVGMGPGYMGKHGIHVGERGNDVAWGKGGKSANAPAWLVEAHRKGQSQRAGFDLATALSPKPGAKPVQVEIASISAKSHDDRVEHYSQSSGLGSIFGVNRAAAAGNPDGVVSQTSRKGDRLGGGLYQNSASGSIIQDRIDKAHESATAHVTAEKIRPNVNPESSIIAASDGITIPSADSFNQRFSGANTEPPKNPSSSTDNPNISSIPHFSDPELMYPLLYHHLGN